LIWFDFTRVINEALSLILTFIYTDETVRTGGEDNRDKARIIVANRVSILDVLALRKFMSNNRCKAVCAIQLN
jgi:hypothetical protein